MDILSSCNKTGRSLFFKTLFVKSLTESHLGPTLPSILSGQPITNPVISYSSKIEINLLKSDLSLSLFIVFIGEATVISELLIAMPSVLVPWSIPNSLFLGKIFNKNSSGLKIGIIDANRLSYKIKFINLI